MRPSVVRRWLFAAAMSCTTIVYAEGPPPLRLDDLVAEARERSPLLQAARERARAASFAPAQAKVLDDPVFSYEAWNTPDTFDIAKADNNILRVAQKIPFPGKRRLAGEVAARGADAAARDADAVERDVVAAVKTAYAELWLAHQNVEVYRRDRTLVERFARIAEQRYAIGAAAQADVLRAQVELTHDDQPRDDGTAGDRRRRRRAERPAEPRAQHARSARPSRSHRRCCRPAKPCWSSGRSGSAPSCRRRMP